MAWRSSRQESVKELEKQLEPYLADDFVGSEAEFWRLSHRYLGLTKEQLCKEIVKSLNINKTEAEKLARGLV
ncbi:MAG: hypothetical protein ACTSV7_13745 [Candidatus Baldrarchaeia archaeon]